MAFKRALVLALALLVVTTGVVLAAFTGVGQAAGTWNEREVREFVQSLKQVKNLDQSNVRIVEVTLTAGGTGWHSHPGAPSLVIVEQGTVNFIEPGRRGECVTTPLGPGSVISHPTGTHDFQPVGETAVFTVVYFWGTGAMNPPLQVDANPCGAGGGGDHDDD